MKRFFHSFRARLMMVLFILLLAAQGTVYFLVIATADQSAHEQAQKKITEAIGTSQRLMARRVAELRLATKLLSKDYAFATAFSRLKDSRDLRSRETLRSMLQNYQGRIGTASFLLLDSLDGEKLADTLPKESSGLSLDPALIEAAEEKSPQMEATGVVMLGDSLHLVVLRPLLMPEPRAWITTAFPLDHTFAQELSQLTGLEIAFVKGDHMAASNSALLKKREFSKSLTTTELQGVTIGEKQYLGQAVPFPGDVTGGVQIVMLRSLDDELAPFRNLEKQLLVVSLLALGVSLVCAAFMAKGVTRPVEKLTEGVARIEHGDYQARMSVPGRNELSQLGAAFNRMAEGLEERDRVRNLLGKTVSPEVAHELLRSGLELGGEIREASILFSDLRGYTAYSETLTPSETVAQLNAYFTDVGAAVEASGGVIDKFIGDAIMAIFGAPAPTLDHADRAIRAAMGFLRAEYLLNEKRAQRGQPPLQTGIGISTGSIVAGAIGSPSRCNYTVIGDAVNLASRLESLTKEKAFSARIICSESTRVNLRGQYSLRDLGEVAIRGKEHPIRIWAIDFDPSSPL